MAPVLLIGGDFIAGEATSRLFGYDVGQQVTAKVTSLILSFGSRNTVIMLHCDFLFVHFLSESVPVWSRWQTGQGAEGKFIFNLL